MEAEEEGKLRLPRVEKLSIEILLEEQIRGNMLHGVFKKTIWTKITEERSECER